MTKASEASRGKVVALVVASVVTLVVIVAAFVFTTPPKPTGEQVAAAASSRYGVPVEFLRSGTRPRSALFLVSGIKSTCTWTGQPGDVKFVFTCDVLKANK